MGEGAVRCARRPRPGLARSELEKKEKTGKNSEKERLGKRRCAQCDALSVIVIEKTTGPSLSLCSVSKKIPFHSIQSKKNNSSLPPFHFPGTTATTLPFPLSTSLFVYCKSSFPLYVCGLTWESNPTWNPL
ncbi:hypothetical protein BSKO_12134 [Bryopsis sp. KO-2023]|nr:hypothetical protein BSKO_12134 [Bryopsis sp. KO-2023]